MQIEWPKFLDTNIFIYAEDKDDLTKYQIALDVIEERTKESDAVISMQVLAEFSSQMAGVMLPNEINDRIADYQNSFQILSYSINEIRMANEFFENYKIHFFDALIAATMKANNIDTIITENEDDFKRIPWLKVINPFKNPKKK